MKPQRLRVLTEPFWWRELASCSGISGVLALRLWRGLCLDEHPNAVALRFRFDQLHTQVERAQNPGRRTDCIRAFTQNSWSPTMLVMTAERLYELGLLRRDEATQIQESILQRTTRKGVWKSGL